MKRAFCYSLRLVYFFFALTAIASEEVQISLADIEQLHTLSEDITTFARHRNDGALQPEEIAFLAAKTEAINTLCARYPDTLLAEAASFPSLTAQRLRSAKCYCAAPENLYWQENFFERTWDSYIEHCACSNTEGDEPFSRICYALPSLVLLPVCVCGLASSRVAAHISLEAMLCPCRSVHYTPPLEKSFFYRAEWQLAIQRLNAYIEATECALRSSLYGQNAEPVTMGTIFTGTSLQAMQHGIVTGQPLNMATPTAYLMQ